MVKLLIENIDESAITKRITNNFLQVFVIHVTINEKFHSFVENILKQWIINTSLLKHREIKDGKVYNRLETMELQRIKKYESHLEVFK